MNKGNILGGGGVRDDWHAMLKSMSGDTLFACEEGVSAGLGVKSDKGRTVIRGGLELNTICWAGGMNLAGVVLLVCGGVSLFGAGVSLLSLTLLIVGLGVIGGGCFVFFARPGIYMSPNGRELILVRGLRSRFHLDAKNIIPRLSFSSDSEADGDSREEPKVDLKLFNIKLRQTVVVITGGQDYAGAICRSLDEMLGTDSMDSTFAEVKLAGMVDKWVAVEAPASIGDVPEALADGEAQPGAAPRADHVGRAMGVGGIIFSGARLLFPERGVAVVKLPFIRRFALPFGIIVAAWILVMLLLSVVGGSAGLTTGAAKLIGEIVFAAVVVVVSLIFWYHGGPITIDYKKEKISGPRRNKCGFAGQAISTAEVTTVQTCLNVPEDAPGYELNLVMKELPRRVHLLRDSNGARVRESAEALAKFLKVSHWDCTGEKTEEETEEEDDE